MLFNRENGRHMDTNDGKEALKVRHFLCRTTSLDLTLLTHVVCRYVRAGQHRQVETRLGRGRSPAFAQLPLGP